MEKSDIIVRIGELQAFLSECEVVVTGRDAPFWRTISQRLTAQKATYLEDAYAAAESEDKSIRNFLGRMEGIDWVINLVEKDFWEQAKRAKQEIVSLQAQLKELESIDQHVDSIIQDPMYQQPGTI